VAMKADVELGGTDQNSICWWARTTETVRPGATGGADHAAAGRTGWHQQDVKSLGNYIGIAESPGEMFGKLMSISDTLMWRYFELLSFESSATLQEWRQEVTAGLNPRDMKFRLASEIVNRFHGPQAGEAAQAAFIARFQQGMQPEDMPRCCYPHPKVVWVYPSCSRRPAHQQHLRGHTLVKQGGVRLDGEKVADPGLEITAGGTHVLQVGKRKFVRVTLQKTLILSSS